MTITNNLGIDFDGDLTASINDLYYDMLWSGQTIRVTPTDLTSGANMDMGGDAPDISMTVVANSNDFTGKIIRRGDFPTIDGVRYEVASIIHGADGVTVQISLVHTGRG